jgi:hypothetical protein
VTVEVDGDTGGTPCSCPWPSRGLRAAFTGHYVSGSGAAGAAVSLGFAVIAVTIGTWTFTRRHA